MKKILPFIIVSALALMACKKGSVSGTVIDPFTGKAVELPTVWIRGTTFNSQKLPGGLPDGKFKFEKIEPGTYTLEAGK
ncbi:MAG: carboxypeptidase-like regulatory domain-containing protein, partial [Fibromonadaceae bacterium]|nr:carboxypeptidase-like regulatory domain-containing protein [Fibromonadaceae bacterium]